MRRLIFILILGFILVLGSGIAGLHLWRKHDSQKKNDRLYSATVKAVESGRFPEAVALIHERESLNLPQGLSEDWIRLGIQIASRTRNIPRIISYFEKYPRLVEENEEASLLLMRALASLNKEDELLALRTVWKGHEKDGGGWMLADADWLMLQGKPDEAMALLLAHPLAGKDDAMRLIRLSLLSLKKNPERSAQWLQSAYQADPKNPDVRLFRAQILEALGQIDQARVEYVAALLASPDNPFYYDQLGEFYRRCGNLALACQTWEQTPNPPDFITLKLLFWRMVWQKNPQQKSSPDKRYAPAGLGELVNYLEALPADRFFDQAAFEKLKNNDLFLEKRQEVYWLQVLSFLQSGHVKEAGELLRSDRFEVNDWNPLLKNALLLTMDYQDWDGKDTFSLQKYHFPIGSGGGLVHQLFEQFAALKKSGIKKGTMPESLDHLLKSPQAYSSVALASGWLEAALLLNPDLKIPEGSPEWYAYGLAKALASNRSVAAALEFVEKQQVSPLMSLLKAELLIAKGGEEKSALPILQDLSKADSPEGLRAAWLLSQLYFESGDLTGIDRLLSQNKDFRQSLAGKEVHARTHLLMNKTAEADVLYQAILDESLDAKVYWLNRLVQKKDYAQALKLNAELLTRLPGNPDLLANEAFLKEKVLGAVAPVKQEE